MEMELENEWDKEIASVSDKVRLLLNENETEGVIVPGGVCDTDKLELIELFEVKENWPSLSETVLECVLEVDSERLAVLECESEVVIVPDADKEQVDMSVDVPVGDGVSTIVSE